jgi:hypothetical protein
MQNYSTLYNEDTSSITNRPYKDKSDNRIYAEQLPGMTNSARGRKIG